MADEKQNQPSTNFTRRGPLGPAPRELTFCYVTGCQKQAIARGMCSTHYNRAWKKNDFPPLKPRREPLVGMWLRVTKETDSKLRKLSRQSGRTVSSIVRDAIDLLINRS